MAEQRGYSAVVNCSLDDGTLLMRMAKMHKGKPLEVIWTVSIVELQAAQFDMVSDTIDTIFVEIERKIKEL